MAGLINPRDLDRRITFQRHEKAQGYGKTGQGDWLDVATVWAQVQDALPSRGERLADGLTIASRPSRVRIRYRADITSDMRILFGDRVMKIMGPPAELGHREGLEMMAQDYSTMGASA